MAVSGRHGRGLVSQDLLQGVNFASSHHEVTGVRVSQIVEMQVGNASTITRVTESDLDVGQPTAILARENEITARSPIVRRQERWAT